MKELQELWRDIKGFEGYYQISNLGNVKSLNREIIYSDKRVIKYQGQKIITKPNKGYEYVKLCKNSKHKTYKVHRLVAAAFILNPLDLPQVNHKDENKFNNKVNNLEWCTQKYNNNYGTRIERQKEHTDYKALSEKLKTENKRNKKVYQYSLEFKLIKVWSSIRECCRHGYDRGAINRCFRGKVKTHKGFMFSLDNSRAEEVS